LSSRASKVLTVTDLDQIEEVCECDSQNSEDDANDGGCTGPTQEHSSLCTKYPTLLHFESENDVKRVMNSGDTTHATDIGQQEEVTSDSSGDFTHMSDAGQQDEVTSSTSSADSDFVLVYTANDRRSDVPLKQDTLHDVTEPRSQFGVNINSLSFNGDPSLLHMWRAENAQNFFSASFDMLPITSPDISPSCSVTSLPQLSENRKRRRHNMFFPVRLKSQALGFKRYRGATYSSLPNLFTASNIPWQSRFKYFARAKESEKKPRQKEELVQIPKSYHVMNHKERLQTAGTATSAVVMRNEGMTQMHSVGPQEAVEALCHIHWGFSECKKMSCGHIATSEPTSPLNGDKKLLPRQSRPNSSPASFRKFLQQLCL